jgi:hypothetical protein
VVIKIQPGDVIERVSVWTGTAIAPAAALPVAGVDIDGTLLRTDKTISPPRCGLRAASRACAWCRDGTPPACRTPRGEAPYDRCRTTAR